MIKISLGLTYSPKWKSASSSNGQNYGIGSTRTLLAEGDPGYLLLLKKIEAYQVIENSQYNQIRKQCDKGTHWLCVKQKGLS